MARYELMSRTYAPTLKEDPAEAELASHRLLLRAGMIRKTAAGLYSYLPFAWRSLMKIEAIIREEMDAIGAQEILVPMIVPGEIWQQSGRWDVYGPELLRLKDRHGRDFVVGPTHEETFVDLVMNELRSYKQLPVTLYQIALRNQFDIQIHSPVDSGNRTGIGILPEAVHIWCLRRRHVVGVPDIVIADLRHIIVRCLPEDIGIHDRIVTRCLYSLTERRCICCILFGRQIVMPRGSAADRLDIKDNSEFQRLTVQFFYDIVRLFFGFLFADRSREKIHTGV